MNSKKYYEPSGDFETPGLITALLITVISAIVLGIVYGYLNYYIPFIYIRVFLTIGLALAVGFTMKRVAFTGKIRNPKLMLGLSIFGGSLALYVSWIAWFYATTEVLFYTPTAIITGQWLLGQFGAWSISDITPTGWALYAFWIIEAAIIIIGTVVLKGDQSKEPYCENCGQWAEWKKEIKPLSSNHSSLQIIKALEANDTQDFLNIKKVDTDPYMKVTLTDCNSCKNMNLIDLSIVGITIDKNGKEEEVENPVMKGLKLNSIAFDSIKNHAWSSAQEV